MHGRIQSQHFTELDDLDNIRIQSHHLLREKELDDPNAWWDTVATLTEENRIV